MNAPNGLAEIRSTFGDIEVAGGAVVGPPGWEEDNCLVLHDVPGYSRALYVHKLIADPLRAALTAAIASRPDYLIRSIGCFNPRFKRSNGSQLSIHSWAAAIDLNADTNPAIPGCPPDDRRRSFASGRFDMPSEWVVAFKAAGWTWGGEFHGDYFDPMHLQYASGF